MAHDCLLYISHSYLLFVVIIYSKQNSCICFVSDFSIMYTLFYTLKCIYEKYKVLYLYDYTV